MMRVLLWKEYREHRSIWLAMAATAALMLGGLTYFLKPAQTADPLARTALAAAAVVLAWTYGMVCGAMLLAGERENATMPFLDILPVGRLQLWWCKCRIGLLLVVGQAVVLIGLLVGLELHGGIPELIAVILLVSWYGVIGLSWGLLFSARGHSVLHVVGLAIASQVGLAMVLFLLANILVILMRAVPQLAGLLGILLGLLGLLFLVCLGLLPLVSSARLFGREDKLRRSQDITLDLAQGRGGYPMLAAAWCAWQQMKRMAVGLGIFSFLLGFVLLAPNPLLWPLTTLFLGVLCGVTVFGVEQMEGSRRFLGDQRFPLTRLWLVFLLLRLALCCMAALLLILPSAIRGLQQASIPGQPGLLGEPAVPLFLARCFRLHLLGVLIPPGQYLLLGLLYGFSMGHLCGLLFQRSIVAAVLAVGSSSLLLSVWVPSLLCGGLHWWQPAGAILLALAASRLILAAWSADRILGLAPLLKLAACIILALGWVAAGIAYRVGEVPAGDEPFDIPPLLASLPTPEDNQAGLLYRSVSADVIRSERRARGDRSAVHRQLDHVLQRGWTNDWPAGLSDLGPWLDQVFAGRWAQEMAEAADLPTGMMENPRLLTRSSRLSYEINGMLDVPRLLMGQGLRRQAERDDAAFVEYLRQGLALVRTLENKAPLAVALQAIRMEAILLEGIQRWLAQLHGQPALCQRVLELLVQHEAAVPRNTAEQVAIDYIIWTNTLKDAPEQMLSVQPEAYTEVEQKAFVLALFAPWEHERMERLLRAIFRTANLSTGAATSALPQDAFTSLLAREMSFRGNVDRTYRLRLCELRAVEQLVALRLYQDIHGQPARSLAALVPRCLKTLPLDPLAPSPQPYFYRLSRGEQLDLPEGKTEIEAWSEQAESRTWPPGPPAFGQHPPPTLPPGAPAGPDQVPGGPPGRPDWPRRPPATPPTPPPSPSRQVPPGQGILWSAGRLDSDSKQSRRGHELMWLVPLRPRESGKDGR